MDEYLQTARRCWKNCQLPTDQTIVASLPEVCMKQQAELCTNHQNLGAAQFGGKSIE
jgi:hypothetical protein